MNLETKRQKSAADRLHWSFSDGRFKYIRGYEEDGEISGIPPSASTHRVGVEVLFDLQEDPDEQVNLADSKLGKKHLPALRKVMDELESKRLPLRKLEPWGIQRLQTLSDQMTQFKS